jgi:serine/threonine-protein kinase
MFRIYPDTEGDIWDMRWPVFYIDHGCIEAYINWLKKTTNTKWRLPTAEEWEKAARGVDGRYYPWGDHFDNSWTCIRDSHQQRPMPEPIGSRPKDVSIYGAIDMAGSISEMTSTLFYANEGKLRNPRFVTKGGSWRGIAQFTRVASRGMVLPNERSSEIGFRLVRDLPQPSLLG